MENANNKKTYSISYEWNNGYDNCLPEEKYYNFGTLTDLCGMSIKDAMKSGGDVYISINCSNGGINNSGNVNCNCNCGGGGGGGNSTGENVITITNKLVGDGLYEIVIDASEKPNADVDVSFTVDSVPYMFTLRAGETSLNTGIKSDSEYSNVDSVEYSTSDKNYKYSIVNNVKSGVFKVTYIVDNVVDSVVEYKYNEKITGYPTPEKEGYTFSGWDGLPEYMPDYDIKVRAKFTVNAYVISYYIDGVLVHSESITYGSAIPVYTPEIPDNLTFLGWDIEIPETMPAMDLVVNGKCESVTTYYTITYIIDGEIVSLVEYASGDTVTHFEAPEKEGYTFNGWDNEPTVMPAQNVEVTGSYTANIYKLTYKVDGEVVSEENIAFGTEIIALENPVKEGYTFSGWGEIPATMPANDVEINGSFTINSYKLIYTIDGEAIAEFVYEFGAIVPDYKAPEKEGFAFNGWDNEPDTMPAMDVTVTGSYVAVEPNEYTITYMIDGKVAHTDVYKVGDSVIPFEAPAKEGYSFSGWDAEIPSVMPERDIVINGSYNVNSYKLVYKIDGEVVSEADVEFGAEIIAMEEPVKEGYTFSGWSEVPATMPANDVEINGSFTVNSYKVIYKIGDEIIEEVIYEFNAAVAPYDTPVKEGYTFSGWVNEPAVMPAHDVEVTGSYTINSYKLIYKVDGEVVSETDIEFGAEIVAMEEPVKEGYTFSGWSEVPATMPANDVEINGSFTINSYVLTYVIDDVAVFQKRYNFGEEITPMEAEPKEGFEFKGWYPEVPETMPAKDLTVRGSYIHIAYTITYMIDGAVVGTDSYIYESHITPMEAPAKEGYSFNGWENLPVVMPANNITVTGSYSVNTYRLTYTIDGEVIGEVDYEFGAIVEDYKAPEKENHVFNGWDNEPDTMPAMDLTVTGSYTYVEPSQYTITYVIDGKVAKADVYKEGDTVVPFEAPAKEGHTFNGWDIEIPSVMPGENITITGSYTANIYKLTYKVDGEVVSETEVAFGTEIIALENPVKEGYTFSGWSDIPTTMPANDVEINGSFTVNSYKLVYKVDGEVVSETDVEFGAEIIALEAPVKEGHTFSGWDNVPATMPANDVEINGTFTVNSYKLVYKIDGEVVSETDVEFGAEIVSLESPVKEGYTFSGWDNVPVTMPANDVEINGTFTINSYKLVYKVDGEVVSEENVEFGAEIVAMEEPVKEGYTFSGWDNVPATMPADNVEINGTFTVNSYNVNYIVDEKVIHTASYEFGADVTPFEAPVKEGYTFNGWVDEPSVMPAHDVNVEGSYSVNSYKLTYTIDGEVVGEVYYEFGAIVPDYKAPEKENYVFNGWDNEPDTMPAMDLTVTGSYTYVEPSQYTITYVIDGKVAKADVYKEGDTVVPFEAPAKEGHTFNGWDIEIPSVMPGENITITGSYTANIYKLTYKVDGEEVEVVDVVFGTEINTIEEPVKEGYTFSGWVGVPATMPAMDIEINGTFTINSYKLTYTIDGVVVYETDVEYNSDITPFEAPAKEGHTFNGWDNEPTVMPANDVNVEGSYTANTYKLTYKVDGEVVSETDVEFGTEIVALEEPVKEGYTFSGWDNVPATMPADNVEINGTFTINTYKITYTIDGEDISEVEYEFGADVTPFEAPVKEGYTFNGWNNEPVTMPAENVTVTGSYTINTYKLTYTIDGEVVTEKDIVYGSVIETIDAPYKEGYSFNGWDNEPDTMPAENVTVTGSYVINSYFIHYNIDGFTVHMAEYQFGAEVTPYIPEEKEGYTFSGWDNEPSVMPAENVSVNGAYSVNSYTITYMVDDIIVKTSTYEFGAEVTPYTPDEKIGYTFNGWANEPKTMPAENIEVTGTYTVNSYTITYKIDDVVVNTSTYNFGETVTTYIPEEKEGYTFKGWANEPKTMPAENIEVTGSYEANLYTITYKVGDEVVHTADFAFGADVTPFDAPVKEGYSFDGWVGEPVTMPAENVVVTGSYTVNVYTLTFVADSVEIDKVEYAFGATVSPVDAPAKEGYSFVSWDALPATMPADDITVTAVYKVNKYNLNYYINDELFETVKVDFGSAVVPLAYEAQYGYTFSGWNGVPATMPAEDVNVYATETANEWTITFEVTGETSAGVVTAYTATYNSAIVAPAMPEISGYSFSWDNVPSTMPNNDITVTGSYKVIVSAEAKVLYGSIQTSLYDEMTTDEILAAMTASGNVIDNVSVVETQEYSFPIYTPTVDFNPDNLDDDEFEAYEENYRYCLYFVIPRDVSSFALIESGISDVTRFYFKDEKHQNFTIDGKVYDIWRMSNLNGTRKDLPISGMIADKYAYTLIVNN